MEDDQSIDCPYRAEYAKSSRSNCKACKTSIDKESLRLGVMVQSPVHDSKIPNWYHFICFFTKQRPAAISLIANFDSLRWDDQQKIKDKLAEVSGSQVSNENGKSSSKRGKKNVDPLLKDFVVEYAKSSRAACRGCEIKIAKDEVRISKKDYESENARMYGGQDRWHHVECFVKLRQELAFFESGKKLPGYENLKKEDKEIVLKALPPIDIPVVKNEDDGAPAEKKIKVEDKIIKQESDKNSLEDKMKKQNKLMYKIRDNLKNLTKNELSALLSYNCQDDPIGHERKLDRLQDAMAFGAILPCSVCKNGKFVYQAGVGYQCLGNITEWSKCTNIEEKPKRTKFKIPEEFQSKTAFLESYKCRIADRIFIREAKPVIKTEPSTSKKLEKFAPFNGMVFYGIGKEIKKNPNIKKKIERWGGVYSSSLTSDVVAVISTEEEVETMSKKMKEVKEMKINVVPETYLDACENGNAVDKILEFKISPWGGDVKQKVEEVRQKSEAKKSASLKSGRFSKSMSTVKLKIVGGSAVDPDSGMEETCHVYNDGTEMWTAVLGLSDVQKNKNSFYKLQLLQMNNKNRYYVFRSWGRIGTTIGGKKLDHFDSVSAAKTVFKEVYFEHTNNHWKNRHNFVKYPDFMYPIDIDYCDEPDSLKMMSESNLQSSLALPVQDLIKMIFDVNKMNKVMKEFELDMEKMPLGKLSKKQIHKAYAVISELQGKDGDIKPHVIADVSNRFYTLIPHNFGTQAPPLLDNKEIIKSKLDMLESLMDMEVAYSLLRETKGVGEDGIHPIDSHYAKLNADIQVLDRDSEEFKLIEKYVKNTHGETHTQYSLDIVDVFKVKRNGEEKKFKPFKKMPNRKLLWHGSRITNFAGILSQGLRIAPPEAPVCGYMFGKGIYFADMVSKSANYCMTSPNNPYGLILLCEVALGEMYERTKADYIEKLPSGKHSTKGVGVHVPDPSGSVTLGDGLEVPIGKPIKQFPDRSHTSLLYNEYIVYDVAQVKVQYLLKLKFNYLMD